MEEHLESQIRRLQDLYWSESDPDGRAFVPLADAHRKAGDLNEARRVLREGLERHPSAVSGHVVLGWVLQEQGRVAEAEASFRAALAVDPRNTSSLRGLGALLKERGEEEEALGLYRDLLALDPLDEALPGKVRELEDRLEKEARGGIRDTPVERPEETTVRIPPGGLGMEEEVDWEIAALQEDRSPLPREEEEGEGVEVAAPAKPATETEGPVEAEEWEEPPVEVEQEGLAEPVVEGGREDEAESPAEPVMVEEEAEEVTAEIPLEDEALLDFPDTRQLPDPLPPSLTTRTMGEILLRQGLLDQAKEVFQRLADKDPGNEELRALLDRVEVLRKRGGMEPVPGAVVPIQGLAPDSVEAGPLTSLQEPSIIVPVEELAPEPARMPSGGEEPREGWGEGLDLLTTLDEVAVDSEQTWNGSAPGDVVPVGDLALYRIVPVEELAPDEPILEEVPPPADVVPISALAPGAGVHIRGLAPEGMVPIQELAPDRIVPVELLAPDAPPDDPELDAFDAWLNKLS